MPEFLLLIFGLVLLTGGAEVLVRGASAIATRFGISDLVVGLTVVAFGTSAPELAVSVKAALAGQGGIAMGNVIGSNIFNVAAILGIAAMVCPLAVHRKVIRCDMPVMLGVSILFALLLMTGGGLARWEGAVLVAGLAAFTFSTVRLGKSETALPEGVVPPPGPAVPAPRLWVSIALVVLGLGLLVLGAQSLVNGAVIIARRLGMSEAVIGLTIVAAGTSLPELATSVVAALRRQTDIAIGNIIGSNIFNVLGIAGTAALVAPINPQGIRGIDIGAMLVTSIVLLPLMKTGFRLVFWEGGALLACYAGYLWLVWPK
jgi:cation:H+ antiporter